MAQVLAVNGVQNKYKIYKIPTAEVYFEIRSLKLYVECTHSSENNESN